MIRPHSISISEQVTAATRDRIRTTRWPEGYVASSTEYGSVPELRQILDFWETEYSWSRWEDRLNSRPHFLCEIDGVDLHFWHVRGTGANPIPLLLLHGWPGSAVEFWDLIGPLTDPAANGAPAAPSFDVVIAELPGFGFGGKPGEPGWGPNRMARALHRLMSEELGCDSYVVHGEDWGAMIAASMARLNPVQVAAIQITMPFVLPFGDFSPAPEWEARMYSVSGYSHAQSQVPDALALGMSDSPIALAAWVLEKFLAWSDNDGTLLSAFDLETLVTILNFYWLGSGMVSATRIYRESVREVEAGEPLPGAVAIPVPTGIAVFPKEPFRSPREWLENVYDIRRYSEFDSGGHFAALENPEVLLTEIREFFPDFVGGGR